MHNIYIESDDSFFKFEKLTKALLDLLILTNKKVLFID